MVQGKESKIKTHLITRPRTDGREVTRDRVRRVVEHGAQELRDVGRPGGGRGLAKCEFNSIWWGGGE
jgi:hypothetical protein